MWKLLNAQDRKSIKAEENKPLTTQGVGQYTCRNCVHYGQRKDDGPAEAVNGCAQFGIAPDLIPCSFSPKRPEKYFRLVGPAPLVVQRALASLEIETAALLSALLPIKIDDLVKQAELRLPYRVGDKVSFVHDQMLVAADVVGFDETEVAVDMNGTILKLPHSTVIPVKRQP